MAKFEKKQPVTAVPVKQVWKKKEVAKAVRQSFKREYTREVKFDGARDALEYMWVFEEHKKPDAMAPQFRLLETKWRREDREWLQLPVCAVAWMVDMQVRTQAYAEFA